MTRSSSSTSSQRRVKERNVPKTGAVDALLYFAGRDPRRVKAVRAVYCDDVDDSLSVRSGSSMWSMWSAGSQNNVHYYFVEPRGYWAEPQEYEPTRKTKSRVGGRPQGPQPNPTAAWARNATVHDMSDDSDSDDGSDTSLSQYGGHQRGPGPGPAPGPGQFMRPPGMAMPPGGPPNGHPHMGGPPAGFPPPYGMGPRPSPHPQMGQPGHGMPPLPPHVFSRPPPPPGPGGQFVANPAGVRGFQG